MHVGTLIPHFKKGDFDKLYIPLPNKELQILTGDLFYEMSEKIEQNRRTSAALERLVRAIFRAWFVDFEPVKAKAAGATSFPSMPQPIFDALPIHLAETNMGPMPEGFEMAPLTCLAKSYREGRPQRTLPNTGMAILDGQAQRISANAGSRSCSKPNARSHN